VFHQLFSFGVIGLCWHAHAGSVQCTGPSSGVSGP
jgi:hypothetical protein